MNLPWIHNNTWMLSSQGTRWQIGNGSMGIERLCHSEPMRGIVYSFSPFSWHVEGLLRCVRKYLDNFGHVLDQDLLLCFDSIAGYGLNMYGKSCYIIVHTFTSFTNIYNILQSFTVQSFTYNSNQFNNIQ